MACHPCTAQELSVRPARPFDNAEAALRATLARFGAGPAVVSAADAAISHARLHLFLPILGIPVPCAVVDGAGP